MRFVTAQENDFGAAFQFMKDLWPERELDELREHRVFLEAIQDPKTYVFFLEEGGRYRGFCHGDYYLTFCHEGLVSYISSFIVEESDRGKGYGRMMMDHVRALAVRSGCRALILDSGMWRTGAHQFYEHYGYEKGNFGFELML